MRTMSSAVALPKLTARRAAAPPRDRAVPHVHGERDPDLVRALRPDRVHLGGLRGLHPLPLRLDRGDPGAPVLEGQLLADADLLVRAHLDGLPDGLRHPAHDERDIDWLRLPRDDVPDGPARGALHDALEDDLVPPRHAPAEDAVGRLLPARIAFQDEGARRGHGGGYLTRGERVCA